MSIIKWFNTRDVISYGITCIVVYVLFMLALDILDAHMYDGVDVIKQDGDILFVKLEEKLTLGTDTACLDATRVLEDVARKTGLYIQVISSDGNWAPFTNRVLSHSDLVRLIEGATPY